MHPVGLFHKLLEGLHGLVHLSIVEVANVKVEVLEGLGAHACHLGKVGVGIAQHAPLGIGYANVVQRPAVYGAYEGQLIPRHVGHLVGVELRAYADICVHVAHELAVYLCH